MRSIESMKNWKNKNTFIPIFETWLMFKIENPNRYPSLQIKHYNKIFLKGHQKVGLVDVILTAVTHDQRSLEAISYLLACVYETTDKIYVICPRKLFQQKWPPGSPLIHYDVSVCVTTLLNRYALRRSGPR